MKTTPFAEINAHPETSAHKKNSDVFKGGKYMKPMDFEKNFIVSKN